MCEGGGWKDRHPPAPFLYPKFVTYTYAWKRGTALITKQAKRVYKLVAADKGKRMSCVVTAKLGTQSVKSGGVATPAVLPALKPKR